MSLKPPNPGTTSAASWDTAVQVIRAAPVNIKDPTYGAVGDAATDDTAAINAALATFAQAGANRGGRIFCPPGVYRTTAKLNLDQTNSVEICGPGGTSQYEAAIIRFTGTTGGLLSGNSSQGLRLRGLRLEYNNAGFTGNLLNFDDSLTPGVGASGLRIEDCWIGGNGVSAARSLLRTSGSYDIAVADCSFFNAGLGIIGKDTAASNVVSVRDCIFNQLTGGAVKNPGQAWLLDSCAFEPLASGVPAAVVRDVGVYSQGLTVKNCWFGDATQDGTWLDLYGLGTAIIGNFFYLVGRAASTAIKLTTSEGTFIGGNDFEGGQYGINAVSASTVSLSANRFQGVATPLNGLAFVAIGAALGNTNLPDQMFGPIKLAQYATANRPAAATYPGSIIYVSDGAAGSKFQGSDGAAWVPLG